VLAAQAGDRSADQLVAGRGGDADGPVGHGHRGQPPQQRGRPQPLLLGGGVQRDGPGLGGQRGGPVPAGPVSEVLISTGTGRGLTSDDPWLFPGRRPGRAACPTTLGHRLRRLGIDPRAARNGALLHLAEYLPARVLADLLGLHINTAELWITTSVTRWMGYAGNH